MITTDEDLKELEKYTFTKYYNNKSNIEQFSQINSFTNNFILNYHPSNNINSKEFNNNNKEIIKSKKNSINRDVNYNELNINHYQKNSLKRNLNNLNNINNLNIINQYNYKTNHNKNYNNINYINIGNNINKRNSFSKENKYEQRKKYKTPDKNVNYNKFNFIAPYESERKIHLYYNESQNSSNKNLQILNKINYNENIRRKVNNRKIKKALTPDNTSTRNMRNFKNIRKNMYIPICSYNSNIKPINLKKNNTNKIFNNSQLSLGSEKFDNLNSILNNSKLNILGQGDNYYRNIKYNLNNKYNSSNSIINKINYNPKYNINNNKLNYVNKINSLVKKSNENSKYNDSSFNNRFPKDSKLTFLNKNLVRSVCSNKTPSPLKKMKNNYLDNTFYNSNHRKSLKYTRSASCDNYKSYYNKLKTNIFKINNKDLNCNQECSYYHHKQMNKSNKKLNINNSNCNFSNYKILNNKYFDKNSISSNIYNRCGYNNSSIFDNNKNNNSSLNDKNYNMTQPEFTKSYNIGITNNKNKIFNNYNTNKELSYNNNDSSQSYNYKSYIESYNNESIKDNIINNWKNEVNNKISNINKYNYYAKNTNISYGNYNKKNISSNYFTKLSTNNNTYDENSNNSNTSCCKDSKYNKKSDTIEEVHLNFVNILQNTKSMMRNQESMTKDKIIYNNINSSVIIVEERDID